MMEEERILNETDEQDHGDDVDETESSVSATPPDFTPHVRWEENYSLALHKKTPKSAKFWVSFFMLVAHFMYAYGQIFPMWRLYYNVDLDMTLQPENLEAELLFKGLGLKNPMNVTLHMSHDIDKFDYYFAIHQLWLAENLGNKFGPRMAAIVLILFSGVWPHVKLILLHTYWLIKTSEISRTTAFYWLSTFGKWSLADVFVVCVMIGVMNLDLEIVPADVLEGLAQELPEAVALLKSTINQTEAEKYVCEQLLHLKCKGGFFDFECNFCHDLVDKVYNKPEFLEGIAQDTLRGIHAKGGGSGQLRIAGLAGIYVFCFAVVVSLVLSFVIDIFDHHARANTAKSRRGMPAPDALGITGSPGTTYFTLIRNDAERTVVEKQGDIPAFLIKRVSRRVWAMKHYLILIAGSFTAFICVVFGIVVESMERSVVGSLPEIAVKIIDIEWGKQYSLWTLCKVTGASGGRDFLLMGTFGWFCVFGPLTRAVLTIIYLIFPASKRSQKRMLTIINFLGAFCAWEVFVLALFLVDMEMPPITSTILDSKDTPLCDILHSAGFPEECFEVEFNIHPTFMSIFLGGTVLMLASSMAVKLGFKALDPYLDGDRGGPYCCACCPPIMFDFDVDIRNHDEIQGNQQRLLPSDQEI